MKNALLACLAIGFLMFGMVGVASATLVGDTVTAQHYFSTLSWPYKDLASTVVADGTSDTMVIVPNSSSEHVYDVDVNAAIIHVYFKFGPTHFHCASFNGLVVDSLNDSTGNPLIGVSINTDMAGWDLSRLSFDDETVFFNWQGLDFNNNTVFNAYLNFVPIPEPGTLLLLGGGLVGLAFFARRRKHI